MRLLQRYSVQSTCTPADWTQRTKHWARALPFSALLCGLLSLASASAAERTVIDNERSVWYTTPYDAQVGLLINSYGSMKFNAVSAQTLKAPHGHFQHFAPNSKFYGDNFPWSELEAYHHTEVTQGRAPLLITATYAGKQRPVCWKWDMELAASGMPTTDSTRWSRPMNLNDERYIKFYIHNYVRNKMWLPAYPNMYMSSDNGAFMYSLYGVLDDQGLFKSGIPWDAPFAQSQAAFESSIIYFNQRLKELAPDIHIIVNEGSLADESRFAQVWQGFAGSGKEDILQYGGMDKYARSRVYKELLRSQILQSHGQMSTQRAVLPLQSDPTFTAKMTSAYIGYLITRGDNFFFNPFIKYSSGEQAEVPPALYAAMQSSLGFPTSQAVSSLEPSVTVVPGDGYRLYSREVEGGIVYWNWTGQTKTIALPTGRTFYDRSGNVVTALTIPDLQGDYVLNTPGARATFPRINPRLSTPVSAYVTVQLTAPEAGASIRYTLDGSEPSATSSLYAAPFRLMQSATIKARTFFAGKASSFTRSASYTVNPADPAVQFHLPTDHGPQHLAIHYPLVALSNPSGKAISVSYQVTGGTAVGGGVDYTLIAGTLTFQPGEMYKYFPLSIVNNSDRRFQKTIQISLTTPLNASLGLKRTFLYTIDAPPNRSPLISSAASANPNPALPGQSVSFSAAATDADGDALGYAWSFGDGSSGTGASVTHVYGAPGSFLATVTVTDGRGASVSSNINIVVNDERVVHWKFDETSGPSASDSSGHGNHGTLTPGATWTSGFDGGAISLDGVRGGVIKNPVVEFPSTALTACFWMKSSNRTKAGTALSYAVPANNNEFVVYNYNNLAVYIKGSAASSGIRFNDGLWHHVAVTWRSSDGRLVVYKDGQAVFTANHRAGAALTSQGSLYAGQEQDTVAGGLQVSQAFLGLLDDVRLYRRVLGASEVRALAGTPAAEAPAAAEWVSSTDSDEDGLLDGYELQAGLDPFSADTDNNDTLDADEADAAGQAHLQAQQLWLQQQGGASQPENIIDLGTVKLRKGFRLKLPLPPELATTRRTVWKALDQTQLPKTVKLGRAKLGGHASSEGVYVFAVLIELRHQLGGKSGPTRVVQQSYRLTAVR